MSRTKKVILTIGIPASGKSTWRREFISKNPDWISVSRDDFRAMLRGEAFLDPKGETLVTAVMFKTARETLKSGYNVVIDNTHCRLRYLTQAIKMLGDLADIEYRYFDTPLETCLKRDALRASPVGESVIRAMSENLEQMVLGGDFDFRPVRKIKKEIPDYTSNFIQGLPSAYIFDIDGTLAHMGDRRNPFDWSMVGVDAIDELIKREFLMHQKEGYKIILVSGRDESCREETLKWLKVNGLEPDELFMRPKGDFRKDSLIKEEIYKERIKGKFNIMAVFDDRDQVVNKWRELGLKCFQVEPGDF